MKATPAMHRFFRTIALAGSCAALLSSGCATVAHGRYQRVQVETYPSAAEVSVNGAQRQTKATLLQFETPGEVVLHRKEKQIILRIEKDGYEPAEVALARKGSLWTPLGGASLLGLVAWGGIEGGRAAGLGIGTTYLGISVGIDLATGAAYRLDPAKVSVALQPKSMSSGEPGPLQREPK